MTQTQPQFQRPLLRIGSILFIAGMVIAIVSTLIHPSREDPSNHPLVLAEYASDDSWIAVHIGQFAGGIMVFAGGFVAYCNHDTYFIVFRYIENFSSHLYIKSTHFMHDQSLTKCFKKHIF